MVIPSPCALPPTGPKRSQSGLAQMRLLLHGLGILIPPIACSNPAICSAAGQNLPDPCLYLYYTSFLTYVNNFSSGC